MTAEDADVETASAGYARRFAGPVGTWFLEVQAQVTLDLLRPWPGCRVLDVGGGHGQLVEPLLAAGHSVTVYGSGQEALGEPVRSLVEAGRVGFRSGSLVAAPWPDRAFDVVTCFRLLPHARAWRDLVAELGRLADRAVVVDYPTRRSVNVAAAALFRVKHGVEKDTRPFRVFRDADVVAAFVAAGFPLHVRRPQFFFPMALHRGLGARPACVGLEAAARILGLRRLLGSPVILRCARG